MWEFFDNKFEVVSYKELKYASSHFRKIHGEFGVPTPEFVCIGCTPFIKKGISYNTFWKQGQVWRVLYWSLTEGIMTYRTVSDPASWSRHCQPSLCSRYRQQPLCKMIPLSCPLKSIFCKQLISTWASHRHHWHELGMTHLPKFLFLLHFDLCLFQSFVVSSVYYI